MQKRVLGSYENAIKCVEYSGDIVVNVTGSWDGTSQVWDPRDRTPCIGTYSQLDNLYRRVGVVEKLVVAKAGRKFLVWDVRNACPQQKRESAAADKVPQLLPKQDRQCPQLYRRTRSCGLFRPCCRGSE